MSENPREHEFTQSFDAREWAAAFVQHVHDNPRIATDRGTMVGWFANALMRGYDEHERRSDRSPPPAPSPTTPGICLWCGEKPRAATSEFYCAACEANRLPPSAPPAPAPASAVQERQQDQTHSGSTMKNQPQVQGLTRDASVCGATWLADYGPLPCDRPAGHTEPHRCYGSQGPIEWRRLSAEPARCACGGVIEGNGGIQDYGGTHEGYVWGGNCTQCGKGYGENDDELPAARRAPDHAD